MDNCLSAYTANCERGEKLIADAYEGMKARWAVEAQAFLDWSREFRHQFYITNTNENDQ